MYLSRNTVKRIARGNKIIKLRLVPTLRLIAVRSFYKTIQCVGANYVNVQFMKHFHHFLRNISAYGDTVILAVFLNQRLGQFALCYIPKEDM
jgi:hypothetical protein